MGHPAPTETDASLSSSETWTPEAFEALDYYDLDELLADGAKAARDEVRAFVTDEVEPIIEEHAQRAEFPRSLIPAFAEKGLSAPRFRPSTGAGDRATSPTD